MTDVKKPPARETGGGLLRLRGRDDIQRAHDMLASLLTGENIPGADSEMTGILVDIMPDERDRERLASACDVLCWVLRHSHNRSFQKNLDEIERRLRLHGYVFQRLADAPQTGGGDFKEDIQ